MFHLVNVVSLVRTGIFPIIKFLNLKLSLKFLRRTAFYCELFSRGSAFHFVARTNYFLLNRLSDAKNSDRNFKTEVGVSRYFICKWRF